jgi:uncharacterized RmlC-like cupin family protein
VRSADAREKCDEWEAGDVVYVPPNTISQHFNADPERVARVIVITNRIYRKCGLNDLEQIENAPEYDPQEQLTAEKVRRYIAGAVTIEVKSSKSSGNARASSV